MRRRAVTILLGISLSLALSVPVGCQRQPEGEPGQPTPGDTRREPAAARAEQRAPEASDPLASAVARIVAAVAAAPDSDDTDARVAAMVALGEPALAHLGGALAHPDQGVRLFAVQVLAESRSPAAVDPLLARLEDPSFDVRLAAVEALGQLRSPRAASALLAQLDRDDDSQVRYECMTSLGLIGSPEAVPRLVAETRNDDPYMRMWAMDALCTMRDPAATSLLPRLLADPNLYTRRQVMRSCQEAARADAPRRALLEITLANPDFESSFVAREALADDFRSAAPDSVARALIQGEAVRALASPDANRSLRAALLLGNLGDPRAFDPLVAALGNRDPLTRHHAAHLLAEVHDRRAVPLLVAALDDPSPLVKATALSSLQRYAAAGDSDARGAVDDFRRRAR